MEQNRLGGGVDSIPLPLDVRRVNKTEAQSLGE